MTTCLVSRDDVCAVVERWMSRHGDASSVLTRSFVADVCDGRDVSRWKDVRAEDLFVFSSPRPRVLLAARSAIVLLPILLTWLAISQVIDPFATYVQNVDASANFLWFWQSNPDGAFASHWRLSYVALLDAALLAALVVLSVRISWYETAVIERDECEYDALIQMVNVFLVGEQPLLFPVRPEPSSQHQSPPESHQEFAPR
jgi:hypothetical protein